MHIFYSTTLYHNTMLLSFIGLFANAIYLFFVTEVFSRINELYTRTGTVSVLDTFMALGHRMMPEKR